MDLETLIENVKNQIGAIIQKPKMADKLLMKPPFRFLHDTISAVSAATGFAQGLYSGEELDSAAITEKQAKINYLEKIFATVGIALGRQLDIRASKVVAGQEPECTNAFLSALAEAATNSSIDSDQAVSRCLSGEQPGSGPPCIRKGGFVAESKAESKRDSDTDRGKDLDNDDKGGGGFKMPPQDTDFGLERGKSRGGTRGGKPNASGQGALAAGLSGFNSLPVNLDSEIEKCDGSENATKEILGALITKPKLADKLLQKPPFRFLFDIVMEVMKVTGFARGLYSDEECDAANVSAKEQKITFLEKIIKVVGMTLNTVVEARPAKIVAGLEPQNTNFFLQLLAVAAKNVPDSSASVRSVMEQMGEPIPDVGGMNAKRDDPAPAPQENRRKPAPVESESRVEVGPSASRAGRDREVARDADALSDDRQTYQSGSSAPSGGTYDSSNADADAKDADTGAGGERTMRPTTARRRPPKVKDGAKELTAKDTMTASAAGGGKRPEGIMIDGQDPDDDDDDTPQEQKRLADDTDAKAIAGRGEQSKLVKDILSRQAEQEAARSTVSEKDIGMGDTKTDEKAVDPTGAGGIRMGRLRKTGLDKGKGVAAGSSGADGAVSTTLGAGDLERMRGSIQLLVQHTGPLGTCMDYIQEDVGMMTGELQKWEEECRKYEMEWEQEKLTTEKILLPLQNELNDLEEQVKEVMLRVSATKANIAKNDNRVQQQLKLIATT